MSFLFGGGSQDSTVTNTTQLSPEQQQLLSQLSGEENQLAPVIMNLLNMVPKQQNAVYQASTANPMSVQNAVMSNLMGGGNYTPVSPGPALSVPMNLNTTPTPAPAATATGGDNSSPSILDYLAGGSVGGNLIHRLVG